jgi:hypothetical protein
MSDGYAATGSATRLVCPRFEVISYKFMFYKNETFFFRNYKKVTLRILNISQ